MRPDGRLGRPVSMGELLAKDGGGVFGNPDKLGCPHCGGEAKSVEVTTPRKGWVLVFFFPPTTCCALARQKARP